MTHYISRLIRFWQRYNSNLQLLQNKMPSLAAAYQPFTVLLSTVLCHFFNLHNNHHHHHHAPSELLSTLSRCQTGRFELSDHDKTAPTAAGYKCRAFKGLTSDCSSAIVVNYNLWSMYSHYINLLQWNHTRLHWLCVLFSLLLSFLPCIA